MKSEQFGRGREPHDNQERSLVSVIVPVYNVAPYLREALDSAVNQTYRRLEIILVDDGSTDGSGDICDEYASASRVRVIHQANRGVSSARNTGLDRATGEYIAFLDPDDAYCQDFIGQMLEAIADAEVAVCRYKPFGTTQAAKGRPEPLAKAGSYDRARALRAYVDGLINGSVCNKLFRKELWKNIRFPEGHIYEDDDTIFRILDLCSRVEVLDRVLYLYRMRLGSITHTSTRKNTEDWILARDHLAAFVEAHIPETFDETHLRKVRQARTNGIIGAFCRGQFSLDEAKAACKGVNTKGLSFRSRVSFRMLGACHWLLRGLYPAYCAFRLLERKAQALFIFSNYGQ